MTPFPKAVISQHAQMRLAERSSLCESTLTKLLDDGIAKRASVSKRRSHLVHRLYWSMADEGFFIAVQDIRCGTVLTILTLEMFEIRHPGIVTDKLRRKVLNKSVLAGLAPKSRWQSNVKTRTYVAAHLSSTAYAGATILGLWNAALPEPDVKVIGSMQQFWDWVLARMRSRGWPLETLDTVSLRLPFADEAAVPYLC